MARKHVFIEGKVQGVFFRDSTRRKAGELGVEGWVRNLPDGRVEGLFEGPSEAVEALIDWCYEGPPAANVEGVEIQEADTDNPVEGFEVLSTPG